MSNPPVIARRSKERTAVGCQSFVRHGLKARGEALSMLFSRALADVGPRTFRNLPPTNNPTFPFRGEVLLNVGVLSLAEQSRLVFCKALGTCCLSRWCASSSVSLAPPQGAECIPGGVWQQHSQLAAAAAAAADAWHSGRRHHSRNLVVYDMVPGGRVLFSINWAHLALAFYHFIRASHARLKC